MRVAWTFDCRIKRRVNYPHKSREQDIFGSSFSFITATEFSNYLDSLLVCAFRLAALFSSVLSVVCASSNQMGETSFFAMAGSVNFFLEKVRYASELYLRVLKDSMCEDFVF